MVCKRRLDRSKINGITICCLMLIILMLKCGITGATGVLGVAGIIKKLPYKFLIFKEKIENYKKLKWSKFK